MVSSAASQLPNLKTSNDSFNFYTNFQLQETLTLRADYWYEHYSSEDWALNGVFPNTIPNAITFGDLSPAYNVHIFMVSAVYKF